MFLTYSSVSVYLSPELLVFGTISIILVKFVWSFVLQNKPNVEVKDVKVDDVQQQNLLRTDVEDEIPLLKYASFQHKASGRSVIFSLGNGHIVKQCIRDEEILFYKNVPSELVPIIPRCCAMIQNQTTTRLTTTCTLCSENSLTVLTGLTGSWLALEDLTLGFNAPCLLDLKLGTRTHPDSADQETAVRKRAKCLKTTSSKLGFRFEGMRIPTSKGDLLHVHKKQDPSLTFTIEEPLKMCKIFFTHVQQWNNILQQIRCIKEVVGKLNGYRFYASSLLIIAETGGKKAKIRLVDFAKTTIPGVIGDHHDGPDRGCLKGLETLENLIVALSN